MVSICIHLFFLLTEWQDRQISQQHLKTPLAVVLVNSQSHIAPLKAKRLAQADLNGGGESKDQMASALTQADAGVAKKLQNLRDEKARLLAMMQANSKNSQTSQLGKTKSPERDSDPFEAELAKRLLRQGQEPRKAIFTATSAKSVVYAQYYDAMRKKVERYGTDFFPRHREQPLYGHLVMVISIGRDGKLLNQPEIKRSSGHSELDRQAIAIVNASAPFGRFSSAMSAQLDVIDWVATFHFVQGQDGKRLELRQN